MNFKINKKELLDALNISSKAVSSTTPLPTLSGIKFEIKNDHINLISSDSNISILIVLDNEEKEILTVEQEGEIVIDSKYILEIVRKTDGDIINFETLDGDYIKIFGINSEYKINGMSGNDYPTIAFNDIESATNKFVLSGAEFFNIVNQTIFACSQSGIKVALTGVNFKAENGILEVKASDSYRLAFKKIQLADEYKELNFNFTIPAKYLGDITHSVSLAQNITITFDNQKVDFSFSNINIQTRLIDDVFPDASKLISNTYTKKVLINSKELLNAIDRTSFIKSEGKNIIKMDINNDSILITSNDQISSSFEKLPIISFEGEPIEVSCSGKYLIDAVKALDCEETCLTFSGNLKPFIVKNENDDSLIQIISPVRTYK